VKLSFKIMLLALILVVASPFILPGSNGKPILSLDKLNLPDLSGLFGRANTAKISQTIDELKSSTDEGLPTEIDDDNAAVHKWIDKHGVWHFSDKQNPDGKDEIVRINLNRNVVQATPMAKDIADESTEDKNKESDKGDDKEASIPFPTTVPMKDIPKLINDTKALKETMDQRYKEQQELLDSLQSVQ